VEEHVRRIVAVHRLIRGAMAEDGGFAPGVELRGRLLGALRVDLMMPCRVLQLNFLAALQCPTSPVAAVRTAIQDQPTSSRRSDKIAAPRSVTFSLLHPFHSNNRESLPLDLRHVSLQITDRLGR
jgi:hypothetical protein